jgi:hypothetical protein
MHTGVVVTAAREIGDGLELSLSDGRTRGFDHVLLGTGYEVDVARYPFLDRTLAERIERVAGLPRLRAGLESSVDGLHFLGAPALLTFGPIMRFVTGSWYAGPALADRVTGRRRHSLRLAYARRGGRGRGRPGSGGSSGARPRGCRGGSPSHSKAASTPPTRRRATPWPTSPSRSCRPASARRWRRSRARATGRPLATTWSSASTSAPP